MVNRQPVRSRRRLPDRDHFIGVRIDHLNRAIGLDVLVEPICRGIVDEKLRGFGDGDAANQLFGLGIDYPDIRAIVVVGVDHTGFCVEL